MKMTLLPRVTSRPWAVLWNPFGIRRMISIVLRSRLQTPDSRLQPQVSSLKPQVSPVWLRLRCSKCSVYSVVKNGVFVMFVEHFLIPEANETNVYLLACSETRRAALIDAGGFEPRVVDCARENSFHVLYILVTHDHYDHVGGLASYVEAFPGCEVIAGGANPGGISARAPADGGLIRVGNLKGTALAIPGHTEDSISVFLDSGDAFIGDLRLENQIMENDGISKNSWARLKKLGVKRVNPGHGYSFELPLSV